MSADAGKVGHDFGRAAATYDHYAHMQCEVLIEASGLLAPYLSGKVRVLDAGCGTGALAQMAATHVPGWNIVGVDIAAPMCLQARRHGMAAVCADIARLPFRDASVDAVLCSLVMQWVAEPRAVLAELLRAIPPGGYGVITAFGEQTLRELRAVFSSTDAAPRVHTFPTMAEMVRDANAAGWHCMHENTRLTMRTYRSFAALIGFLKGIGATNKLEERRRGLTAPAVFRQAEAAYSERFGAGEGIYASWEVHTLLLQKPAGQ